MPQPPRPQRPPEVIPGLDDLLKDPGPLHNVTITRGHSTDPGAIDINATCTDPATGEEMPVGIFWKRNGDAPDSQHFRAAAKTSKFSYGRTNWNHLEAELGTPRSERLKEACLKVLSEHQMAMKCQEGYIEVFESFLVERFDEIAQQPPRTPRRKQQHRYASFDLELSMLHNFAKNIKSTILSDIRFSRANADHRVNVTALCYTWHGPESGIEMAANWEDPGRHGRPTRHVRIGKETHSKYWSGAVGGKSIMSGFGPDLQTAAKEIMSIQDWADKTIRHSLEEARRHAIRLVNDTAARRTRGQPPLPREEGYSSGWHPVAALNDHHQDGATSKRTDMAKHHDPTKHPRPTPGDPHLYDVRITPSDTRQPHVDIEATFPDYVFPEGAPVRLFWDKYATGEPTLMVQAGMYSTAWNNGKFSYGDLRLQDEEHPMSKVRLEAISALHAIYEAIDKKHNEAILAAHDRSIAELNAEIQKRTKHLPHMGAGEAQWLTSQPGWFPKE